MSLGDEIDTDEGAARMCKAELLNMGMPTGMMLFEVQSATEVDRIKQDWKERYGGPEKAGQIHIAGTGRGKATWFPFSREKLFGETVEQRKFLRDMFIQVHGISPELFGVLDGSTRDSAYVANLHLALGALVPWCELLCDVYQAHLLPDFADPERVFTDFVSPVPEDRDLKLRCVATAPSAFRVADVRAIGGFVPDAELGPEQLGEGPQAATPTQLPRQPGAKARLLDPEWARALASTATSVVRSGT
jgi:hypothetical protein